MHGEVDLAAKQRVFQFLGEQTLAAKLPQRLVLNPVTGGLESAELRVRPVAPVSRNQPEAHFIGLQLRQRAASGADYQGMRLQAVRSRC